MWLPILSRHMVCQAVWASHVWRTPRGALAENPGLTIRFGWFLPNSKCQNHHPPLNCHIPRWHGAEARYLMLSHCEWHLQVKAAESQKSAFHSCQNNLETNRGDQLKNRKKKKTKNFSTWKVFSGTVNFNTPVIEKPAMNNLKCWHTELKILNNRLSMPFILTFKKTELK